MLKRLFSIAFLVILGAGVSLIFTQPWNEEKDFDSAVDRLIAEKVSIRTITDEITVSGVMRRDELQTIKVTSAGRLNSINLEEGDSINSGEKLFTLDGRPSISVNGDFSFYRMLDVGSQGSDVEQLEKILELAGYEVGIVDQFYTEDTRSGLEKWQKDFGFSGVTNEVDELVNVSLLSNPAGYKIGSVNNVALKIKSTVEDNAVALSGRQGTPLAETLDIPVLKIAARPAVVLEGGKIILEILSDPAPSTEIEVEINISGDVTESKDYKKIEKKFSIPAGQKVSEIEILVLADDELETNEDLTLSLVGQFTNEDGVAPQTLKIFDLEVEIKELNDRYLELSDSARIWTEVEQELIDEQIILPLDAWDYDFTPLEAQNLLDLQEALQKAERDYRNTIITVAAKTEASEAYEDALEEAKEERSEVEQEEYERIPTLLESKTEELRSARAARWIVGETNEVTVIIDDPDAPDVPVLVLKASSDQITESGTVSFSVETTGEIVEDLIVFFEVSGDVESGKDYNTPSGDIKILKGTKRASISITTRDDDLVESDEAMCVQLLEDILGEYQLSTEEKEVCVQVVSPDLPEITLFGGADLFEGETSNITFVADQAPKVDTSINYSVSGSAQAGIDYQVLTGSALLRAGEKSVEVPLRALKDDVVFMPGDMIVADWPARVGRVYFEKEDFVASGAEILQLTEPAFTVTLFATPTARAKLSTGQQVEVRLDAGDQESGGIISQLDDSASTTGTSERYEGIVITESTLVAVEGAVVSIDVVVDEVQDAVVVPIAAVLTDGQDEKVRVVTRDGVIERRVIRTGMLDGAWVEVVSGVSPEEFVIIEIERS